MDQSRHLSKTNRTVKPREKESAWPSLDRRLRFPAIVVDSTPHPRSIPEVRRPGHAVQSGAADSPPQVRDISYDQSLEIHRRHGHTATSLALTGSCSAHATDQPRKSSLYHLDSNQHSVHSPDARETVLSRPLILTLPDSAARSNEVFRNVHAQDVDTV